MNGNTSCLEKLKVLREDFKYNPSVFSQNSQQDHGQACAETVSNVGALFLTLSEPAGFG